MSKRANFSPRDDWETIDRRAVQALMPYIGDIHTFAEPCAGSGKLVDELESHCLTCVYRNDIKNGADAALLRPADLRGADAVISNPPWTRDKLHRLLDAFIPLKPAWLLFDSDWAFNRSSAEYLRFCSHIVPVGRLVWVPGTTTNGYDNTAWYRFHGQRGLGPRLCPRA